MEDKTLQSSKINSFWSLSLSLFVIAISVVAEYWTIFYVVNYQLTQLFAISQINGLQVIAIMIFNKFLKFRSLDIYEKRQLSIIQLKKIMFDEIFAYLFFCGLTIFGFWILTQFI